jgi:hypothetical protein
MDERVWCGCTYVSSRLVTLKMWVVWTWSTSIVRCLFMRLDLRLFLLAQLVRLFCMGCVSLF